MTRDGEDRDLPLLRPVAPEDAVGGWRGLLGVRFEDVFTVGPRERLEPVGLETWVARIRFQPGKSLPDGPQALRKTRVALELFEIRPRPGSDMQREGHQKRYLRNFLNVIRFSRAAFASSRPALTSSSALSFS
jgi:hypothetical protein